MSVRVAAVLPPPPAQADRSTRNERVLWIIVAAGVLVTLLAAIAGKQPATVLALFVIPLALVSYQRVLLAWQTMFAVVLLVILFIPIRRYTVGQGLPIALEPYRVIIALVLACWGCALAADPNVRWKATGYAAPVVLFWGAVLGSLGMNVGRVIVTNDFVIKAITFFGSYFLLMCFISSVIKPGREVDRMLRLIVLGGGIVAILALYEWRTSFNSFNGLGNVFPFLTYEDEGAPFLRGTGTRARGSAEHPIALGAMFVMLLPLSVYLFKRSGQAGWLVLSALLTLGALSTGSRTAAVMLIVVLVVFLWFKRTEIVRLLPYLAIMFVLIQGVMPGTLGSFRVILNPSFISKEQSQEVGAGTGRIADLGPAFAEWAHNPFVGQGFGTRITSTAGFVGGAQILDDQWLGTLIETGLLGVLALAWLFGRAVRRLARVARSDAGPDSWLAASLAAAIVAYAVGMITFDAFAFTQVTFIAFVMLALAALVTRDQNERDRAAAASRWRRKPRHSPQGARATHLSLRLKRSYGKTRS